MALKSIFLSLLAPFKAFVVFDQGLWHLLASTLTTLIDTQPLAIRLFYSNMKLSMLAPFNIFL